MKQAAIAIPIAFGVFLGWAMIHYKSKRTVAGSTPVSYTALKDSKRSVFLRNNEDGTTQWHSASVKRCHIIEGETKTLNLYTYHFTDRDGNIVKKETSTDWEEVSRAFCH